MNSENCEFIHLKGIGLVRASIRWNNLNVCGTITLCSDIETD